MHKIIKSDGKKHNVTVETDGAASICIWQENPNDAPEMVMLFSERMARKTLKALKAAAEEIGWEV
jgi:hypothetical protein